jgi:hypothetical protein
LTMQDLLRATLVCKNFRDNARHDILWQAPLAGARIWGPHRQWHFKRERNSYEAKAGDDTPVVASAYEQCKAYKALMSQSRVDFPEFFNYFARLMKTGPVGFSQIEKLNLAEIADFTPPVDRRSPIDGVLPEMMRKSLMVGRDNFNRNFLALKLIDQEAALPTPFVLVFVQPTSEEHLRDCGSWYHNASPLGPQNSFNTEDDRVRNYFLRLIKGEPYSDELPRGLSRGLQLVH